MKYKDTLEPIAAALMNENTSASMGAIAAAMSQAASLKRIADTLERLTDPMHLLNMGLKMKLGAKEMGLDD